MSKRAACLAWSLVGLLACAGGDDQRVDPTLATSVGTDGTGDPQVCVPGAQSSCACPGGREGVQVCEPDGSALGECACESADATTDESDSHEGSGSADASSSGPADPCGDLDCADDESCESCPEDCGECVPCTAAPVCDGALVPPAITTHAEGLDDVQMALVDPAQAFARIVAHVEAADAGTRLLAAALAEPRTGEHELVARVREIFAQQPAAAAALRRQLGYAGMVDPEAYRDAHPEPAASLGFAAAGQATAGGMPQPCDNPRLRIRVARLDVIEEDDDFTNDEVYCVITAEGGAAAEIRVTPITPPLDEGDNIEFALAQGVVWGQQDLVAPMGGISLTYNCIESDTADGYSNLLEAIGDAADQAGGMAGDNGWIFGAVGIVSDLLPSVLSLDSDDQLFNASQIVPEDMHLALTQGAYWEVRRSGTHLNSDWDWLLRMEIWGCHDDA
jgi:hypothetical protein